MEGTPVRLWSRSYRDTKRLYRAAFPREERFPFLALWLLSAWKRPVALTVWRDGGVRVGFTWTVDAGRYLYLGFVAVEPDLRSAGYGGRLLSALEEAHPGRAVIVEIEPVEADAPNAAQRERRLAFYLRNGFFDLDRRVTGGSQTYSLLSTDRAFDSEAYWEIFRIMSLKWLVRAKRLAQRLGMD